MAACPLTRAELSAIDGIVRGLSYKQMAAERTVSVSTIRSHIHSAYKRLGVIDGTQAALVCVGAGWVDPPASGWVDHSESRTAALLQHVILALEELSRQVEREVERNGLTPAQRAYLDVFGTWLRARDDAASQVMADQFRVVMAEAKSWRPPDDGRRRLGSAYRAGRSVSATA